MTPGPKCRRPQSSRDAGAENCELNDDLQTLTWPIWAVKVAARTGGAL